MTKIAKLMTRSQALLGGAVLSFSLLATPALANDPVQAIQMRDVTQAQQDMIEDCFTEQSSSRAIRACSDFIRQSVPDNNVRAGLHMRRGLHQLAMGRLDKAGADFERAAVLSDQDDFARLGQGFVAVMNQDLTMARAQFRDCSKTKATAPLAEYGLGLTYQIAGDTDKAKDAYERAVELRPGWELANKQLDTL